MFQWVQYKYEEKSRLFSYSRTMHPTISFSSSRNAAKRLPFVIAQATKGLSGASNAFQLRYMSTTSSSVKGAPEIVLYQYAICPFCNITKSFMSFAGDLHYKTIEVNPLTKTEIKTWYVCATTSRWWWWQKRVDLPNVNWYCMLLVATVIFFRVVGPSIPKFQSPWLMVNRWMDPMRL